MDLFLNCYWVVVQTNSTVIVSTGQNLVTFFETSGTCVNFITINMRENSLSVPTVNTSNSLPLFFLSNSLLFLIKVCIFKVPGRRVYHKGLTIFTPINMGNITSRNTRIKTFLFIKSHFVTNFPDFDCRVLVGSVGNLFVIRRNFKVSNPRLLGFLLSHFDIFRFEFLTYVHEVSWVNTVDISFNISRYQSVVI